MNDDPNGADFLDCRSLRIDSEAHSDARSYGPRERLQQLGESRLSDAECLALILRSGRRGESAEQMAQRLLQQFGGLPRLAAATLGEVVAVAGVGRLRAASLLAAFGLSRRLAECRWRPGTVVTDSREVARLVLETVRQSRRESFYTLLLDARHRVVGMRLVSVGTLNSAPVHPREVFGPAVRESAAALIVAHNHPSGDARPSPEDRRITDRLREVGEVLGIQVLDHLVVGAARFYSFADNAFHPLPGTR